MKNYMKIFLGFAIVGGAVFMGFETMNSLKAPTSNYIIFYQNIANAVPESSYIWSIFQKVTPNLSQSYTSKGYEDLEVPMSNTFQDPYVQAASNSDSKMSFNGSSWNGGNSMYERTEIAYNNGGGSGSMGFASSSNGGSNGSDGSSMSVSSISFSSGAKQLATEEVLATEDKITIDPGVSRGEMIPVGDGLLLLIILSAVYIFVKRLF